MQLYRPWGHKESDTTEQTSLQRIARRHRKAFLSDQCKEIEENSRVGKTRDFFKKTRDNKGIIHSKMGTTKDRNNMGLTSRRY